MKKAEELKELKDDDDILDELDLDAEVQWGADLLGEVENEEHQEDNKKVKKEDVQAEKQGETLPLQDVEASEGKEAHEKDDADLILEGIKILPDDIGWGDDEDLF